LTFEALIAAPARSNDSATGGDARTELSRVRSPSRRFEIAPHNCFACGQLNVNGMHLDLHAAADRCWTDLTVGRQFEGWDGIVHGGIVATILDEVMAWALVDHDLWGVTARMSLDFRRPVLVGMPIRAEGWVVSARRRLVDAAGEIRDATTDELLATAQGRYVGAGEDRKRELRERYRVLLVDDVADLPEQGDAQRSDGERPAGGRAPKR